MYGSVLRRARAHRGLTQIQLAEISGVEQPNISAIETGRRTPSTETLHRLLTACGFELLAVAGERTLPLPVHDGGGGAAAPEPSDDSAPPDLPMSTRVRMLTAALDAAEATVRAR
jgi:transcriptional regulator with XRE-family HTH domain